MSVIVKNMEMPKSCSDCRFYDDNHDYPTCIVTGYSRGYNWSPFNQRMPDCPLVEISEPHGELIDRDSLLQEVHKRLLLCTKYENDFQKPYEIIRAIETAPVIIQKEGDAE